MSQENEELVRRAFEALDRQGIEGLLSFLDPGIEWISIPGFLPDARDYHGTTASFGGSRESRESYTDRAEALEAAGLSGGRARP